MDMMSAATATLQTLCLVNSDFYSNVQRCYVGALTIYLPLYSEDRLDKVITNSSTYGPTSVQLCT